MRDNMKLLAGIVLLLLIFGCTSEQPSVVEEKPPVQNDTMEEPVIETNDSVPGIIEVPDEEQVIEDKKDAGIARSQDDCATLSPDCGSCVAREGCGWCKESQSCFFGNEDGPKVSSCSGSEWAYTLAACEGPKGGGTCDDQWNCADCLSGEGCQWCIQGAVCAPVDTTEDCFGGWMTQSFQCNYASR